MMRAFDNNVGRCVVGCGGGGMGGGGGYVIPYHMVFIHLFLHTFILICIVGEYIFPFILYCVLGSIINGSWGEHHCCSVSIAVYRRDKGIAYE